MKTEGKTMIWLTFYQLVIIVVCPSFPILFPLPTYHSLVFFIAIRRDNPTATINK